MWVAELAKRSGVNAETIRYYTRLGLLYPRREPGNGYRIYRESDIARLEYIRSTQLLGFTLSEIAEFLSLLDVGQSPVEKMKQALSRHVELKQTGLAEQLAQFKCMTLALAKWDECVEPVVIDLQELEQRLKQLLAAYTASMEYSPEFS